MLSLLGSVYNFFRGRKDAEIPIEELEDTVLREYQAEINSLSTATKDGNSDIEISTDVGVVLDSQDLCQHRSGTVTHLFDKYGLIDNKYYFNVIHSYSSNLQCGLRVKYVVFRNTSQEEWRVHRITAVEEESWEDGTEAKNVVKRSNAIHRTIISRLVSREENVITVDPPNTFILENVKTTFEPIPGDWLALTCLVEVCGDTIDFSGEVVNIEEMSPMRKRDYKGQVTQWNPRTGKGVIGNEIWFTVEECRNNYIPQLNDTVTGLAIESYQEKLSWRALNVLLHSLAETKNEKKEQKESNRKELTSNKHAVFITNGLNFGTLEKGERKELAVEIVNNSKIIQVLRKGRFRGKKSDSQMSIHGLNDDMTIAPGQKITCYFYCEGKFLGHSSELFVFTFQKFSVFRDILVEVQDLKITQLFGPDVRVNRYTNRASYERKKKLMNDNGHTVPGIRVLAPPAFLPVRLQQYTIPQYIWNAVLGEEHCGSRDATLERVKRVVVCLNEELNFRNYCTKFHTLLHLEEIEQSVRMCDYDIENAVFTFAGPLREYLAIKVEGLAERRPSLLVGDRVCATSSAKKNMKYEGYIHHINAMEIWIKFSATFHASYDSSPYFVTFLLSRTSLKRCHSAVDYAYKHLGPNVLFPEKVRLQNPQILLQKDTDIQEQNDSNTEDENKIINSNYEEVLVKQLGTSTNNMQENATAKKKDEYLQQEGTAEKKEDKQLQQEGTVEKRGDEQLQQKKNNAEKKGDEQLPQENLIKIKWFNTKLNFLQKQSIRNILEGSARPLPYVIFGPPGTGKTMTLVEAILQIYSLIPYSRIVIATPSNSSANLVTERLLMSNVLKPGDLVRLVSYHYLEDGSLPEILLPYCSTCDLSTIPRPNNMQTLQNSPNSKVLGYHRITVGTCVALGQLYLLGFPRGHFTHVFVDEAGQAVEPEILIPFGFLHYQWGQLILAGDPMQLGPVVVSNIAKEFGYHQSFLVRILKTPPYENDISKYPESGGYNPHLVTRLLMNYRSLPEILKLPSSLFYNSVLMANIDPEDSNEATCLRKFTHILPKRSSLQHSSLPPAVVFHGVRGLNIRDYESPSWYNPQEIVQILYYLQDMFNTGISVDDIGIITPYQKQVQKMRSLLTQLELPVPKIGSVEEFQGQERMVIILSTVRSTPQQVDHDIRHSLGFIASPQRLNVAITRARALLIILGNPHLLEHDPFWKKVIQYSIDNNAYIGCDLPKDLMTFDDISEE